MRAGKARTRSALILLLAGGVFAATGIGVARADGITDVYTSRVAPTICAALDASPTDARVQKLMDLMAVDGLTVAQQADVLVTSVWLDCPWQRATVEHYSRPAIEPGFIA